MSNALKRASLGSLPIEPHAIKRRLEAAGAGDRERNVILTRFRLEIEEAIRAELLDAYLLPPVARSVMLDSWHEAHAGLRREAMPLEKHDARHLYRADLHSLESEFYLVGREICYVVRAGMVMTAIPPNPAQVRRLQDVLQRTLQASSATTIKALVERACSIDMRRPKRLGSGVYSQVSEALQLPPSWKNKPNACWRMVVLPDDMRPSVLVQQAKAWLVHEYAQSDREALFIEINSSLALLQLLQELKGYRKLLSPQAMHAVPTFTGTGRDRAVQAWWDRMFRSVRPSSNRMMMAVRPQTAHAILEILDEDQLVTCDALAACVPGSIITLRWEPVPNAAPSLHVSCDTFEQPLH